MKASVVINLIRIVSVLFLIQKSHTRDQLQVLRAESEIHSRLNHKNIIKMLDYYDSDKEVGSSFLSM